MPKRKDGDYEIGYKKPPKSGQFKPGRSGNPKGRPKAKGRPMLPRIEDFHAIMHHQMLAEYEFTENGEVKSLPGAVLFIKGMIRDAFKGDKAARRDLLKLWIPVLEKQEAEKLEMLSLLRDRGMSFEEMKKLYDEI